MQCCAAHMQCFEPKSIHNTVHQITYVILCGPYAILCSQYTFFAQPIYIVLHPKFNVMRPECDVAQHICIVVQPICNVMQTICNVVQHICNVVLPIYNVRGCSYIAIQIRHHLDHPPWAFELQIMGFSETSRVCFTPPCPCPQ